MGTLHPFLSLHPLRKGKGNQCQVMKKKKKAAKIFKKFKAFLDGAVITV